LPEQAVVLETSPDQARAIARRHISRYLDLPNYTNNWRRLGFTDDDLVGQGSDRLVDALVAWGDVETVSRRLTEHLDAGADHVCIQVFDAEAHGMPLLQWRKLAAAML
jgi:probable F420-dependent oxidoreductase